MLLEPGGDNTSFAMVSLSVVGDQRAIPELQPPLAQGIHLRWAFDVTLGFPWYGFYLFRRPTPTSVGGISAAGQLAATGVTAGPLGTTSYTIPLGTFTSDVGLTLTEAFPDTTTVEVDLSGGSVEFHLNPSSTATSVEVQIGLTEDYPPRQGSTSSVSGGLGGPGMQTTECTGTENGPTGGEGSGPGNGDGTLGGNPRDGGVSLGGGPGGWGPGGGGLGTSTVGGNRATGGTCACSCGSTSAAGVEPILERMIPLGDGTYLATFGYFNPGDQAISVPIGPDNGFVPGDADRGQPTLFLPGCHSSVLSTVVDGTPTTWTLGGQTETVTNEGAVPPTSEDGILISIYRSGVCITTRVVRGRKGEIVTVPIIFEAIDEVRITGAPASIVDIVVVPGGTGTGPGTGVDEGWEPVANFPQPMGLPVFHLDYPCHQSGTDLAAAEQLAMQRIRYGSSAQWQGEPFKQIHDVLVNMVNGGPLKGPMDYVESVDATPDPSSTDLVAPTWKDQSALALLMSASVHPAMAQMLGVYWVDDTTVQGQLYDYMLVADYDNAGGGDVNAVKALINAKDYTNITAYQRSGVRRLASGVLPAPRNLRAYALPLTFVPTEMRGDVAGAVGLRWDVPAGSDGRIAPDAAILYHLWRHDYGVVMPAEAADPSDYTRLTESPVAPGQPRTTNPPTIKDWPAAGVFHVDGPLFDGWYGYCVNGIDIFGRYSARSQPSEWVLATDDSVQDYRAVHLVDTVPPPAPLAVVAAALDPKDPDVLRDAAYSAWRNQAGNANTVGLRVSWSWTGAQIRRAPDTREFRIYVSPGASLKNSGDVVSWQSRIAVIGIDECIQAERVVPLRGDLTGTGATVSGNVVTLADGGALDGIMVYGVELELPTAVGQTHFFVTGVDTDNRTVTVDGSPQVSGSAPWKLGIRERKYEVFLPGASLAVAPDFALPGAPSLASPVAYNVVGVSAADDKTNEEAKKDIITSGPLANRYGNEGPVAGPATVYRVWRVLPGKATLPSFPGRRLWATRADFHSHSYFSFHFGRQDNLLVHVYRALDETLFLVDAAKGFAPNRRTSDSNDPPVYPSEWTEEEKQAAAAQLNALTSAADYSKLGDDALRVLASFASNVAAFACLTETPIPSSNADERGKSDPADYTPQTYLSVHHDTLDGRSVNRYFYRSAFVDSATNAGELGPSTPPVYLPECHLPRMVRITRASGAEQSITVTWPDQVGAGIKSYRLFRTDNKNATRNIRHMVEVLPAVLAGTATSGEIEVVDHDVIPLRDYFYRLVTVSESGVESEASPALAGRALQSVPSASPTLNSITRLTTPSPGYEVGWTTWGDTYVLLQRRTATDAVWKSMSGWISPGSSKLADTDVDDGVVYEYRLSGRDSAGMQTDPSNVMTTEGI